MNTLRFWACRPPRCEMFRAGPRTRHHFPKLMEGAPVAVSVVWFKTT
jgi:hypothetical protein